MVKHPVSVGEAKLVVISFGECIQKLDAVLFSEDARVQNGDDTLVIFLPNESSHALSEFNECIRQGQFHEWTLTLLFDPITFGFSDWMGGVFEG
jgi:hypothetical protein